ncbi:unnamed protein product [Acanthosepion pharaonis]|uniref:Uncharacterized protein n=1 Tax=Acanthosepion pharaonis TaxID=158019 RepID=A0A812DW20_ACAPH|nr:unnamed protein product [Sepia pharaonis]
MLILSLVFVFFGEETVTCVFLSFFLYLSSYFIFYLFLDENISCLSFFSFFRLYHAHNDLSLFPPLFSTSVFSFLSFSFSCFPPFYLLTSRFPPFSPPFSFHTCLSTFLFPPFCLSTSLFPPLPFHPLLFHHSLFPPLFLSAYISLSTSLSFRLYLSFHLSFFPPHSLSIYLSLSTALSFHLQQITGSIILKVCESGFSGIEIGNVIFFTPLSFPLSLSTFSFLLSVFPPLYLLTSLFPHHSLFIYHSTSHFPPLSFHLSVFPPLSLFSPVSFPLSLSITLFFNISLSTPHFPLLCLSTSLISPLCFSNSPYFHLSLFPPLCSSVHNNSNSQETDQYNGHSNNAKTSIVTLDIVQLAVFIRPPNRPTEQLVSLSSDSTTICSHAPSVWLFA